MLVAPVPLRIRCLHKSIENVDVLKTNGKPMILHDFCVTFVCVVVFAPSYLGLVLSLRDVELRPGSWCPEVASNYFALTFSVSRGRFRIFTLKCPAAGLKFGP